MKKKFIVVSILIICMLLVPNKMVMAGGLISNIWNGGQQTQSIYFQPCVKDSGGNLYSSHPGWSSLSEAMNYYGRDFYYSRCYKYYNGKTYNYNYSFSDGTKMYFIVRVK